MLHFCGLRVTELGKSLLTLQVVLKVGWGLRELGAKWSECGRGMFQNHTDSQGIPMDNYRHRRWTYHQLRWEKDNMDRFGLTFWKVARGATGCTEISRRDGSGAVSTLAALVVFPTKWMYSWYSLSHQCKDRVKRKHPGVRRTGRVCELMVPRGFFLQNFVPKLKTPQCYWVRLTLNKNCM